MTTKTKRPKHIHPSDDAILAAMARDDLTGFCLACGAELQGYESDADRATCEACGKPMVYGAEQLTF